MLRFLLPFIAVIAGSASAAPAETCTIGAYRSGTGDLVAVMAPSSDDNPAQRYAYLSGHRGAFSDADAPLVCVAGELRDRANPKGAPWTQIAMRTTPSRFQSGPLTLNGLLLEPAGLNQPPLVVLVHGSEKTSPIQRERQLLLTAQGVSTFAFDKRGTGGSQGDYTQDFLALAADAANAAQAARKLAAGRFSRIGFYGGSQGGWIAPLAALRAKADFVAVGFGVVGTAIEQDQWQVDYQLKELGFGDEVLPKVHEITDATGAVALSNFQTGMNQVHALKTSFAGEPWLEKIEGQYSGELLRDEVKRALHESPQVPWKYSGLATIRALRMPQLWVFAADDDVAPSAPSIARLTELQRQGHAIKIIVYPSATHGMRRISRQAGGPRATSTDIVPGFAALIADFVRGDLKGDYGDGTWITQPAK